MGLFADCLVLVRGGGDLATGVASRLYQAGFPLIVLELARPLVVRRRVALATAVLEGTVRVEGLLGKCVRSPAEAQSMAGSDTIPVFVAAQLSQVLPELQPKPVVIVDARLAKRNIDTRLDQAPLVIALGPGFEAGVDCHAVVETMRGHGLGRVLWEGKATPDTGTPGIIAGKAAERVLRAPLDGRAAWSVEIGDIVDDGQLLGEMGDRLLTAPFSGVVRGLISPDTVVSAGTKIGDIDARGDVDACFTISDKALAIGGGVLEAILYSINRQELLATGRD